MTDAAAGFPELIPDVRLQALRLAGAVAVRGQIPGRPGGKPRSLPPWNAPAAHLMNELELQVRLFERQFREGRGFAPHPRGTSWRNTFLALETLPGLATGLPEKNIRETCAWLGNWCSRARQVLGELELPHRLPRVPGSGEPVCPFCMKTSLRAWPLRGLVRCIAPACVDEHGRKPYAVLRWSDFTQALELIWQDGVTGIPVPAGAEDTC